MKKAVGVLVLIIMAAGFDWGLPQETNDVVQITIKNQFSIPLQFYINDTFACSAMANSSCTARVKSGKGPYKLEGYSGSLAKVVAHKELDTLPPGENYIWETGNVEFNPRPRRCQIAMYNQFDFPVKFFINGEDRGWCLAGQGFYLPATVDCGKGPYKIEVKRSNGEVVRTDSVPNWEGEHVFNWYSGDKVELPPAQETPSAQITKPAKGSSAAPIIVGVVAAGVGAYFLGRYLAAAGWDGTYDATVFTWSPIGNVTGTGTFTVTSGQVSDPGGTFTGTVDANGKFTGTTIISQGGVAQPVCGTFDKVDTFVLTTNGNGCIGSTKVGQRITAKKR